MKGFTDIDDPYQAPIYLEIRLVTVEYAPEKKPQRIVGHLQSQGFVSYEGQILDKD